MKKNGIVVTGLGAVTAVGTTLDETWKPSWPAAVASAG